MADIGDEFGKLLGAVTKFVITALATAINLVTFLPSILLGVHKGGKSQPPGGGSQEPERGGQSPGQSPEQARKPGSERTAVDDLADALNRARECFRAFNKVLNTAENKLVKGLYKLGDWVFNEKSRSQGSSQDADRQPLLGEHEKAAAMEHQQLPPLQQQGVDMDRQNPQLAQAQTLAGQEMAAVPTNGPPKRAPSLLQEQHTPHTPPRPQSRAGEKVRNSHAETPEPKLKRTQSLGSRST